MNNLSWLLYFAGVCDGIGGLFIFFAVIFGFVSVGLFVIFCCTVDSVHEKATNQFATRALKYALPGMMVSALIAAFIPSERTVYLIAASETGEQFAKTETGQKAVAAINRYLDTIGVKDDDNSNTNENKQEK